MTIFQTFKQFLKTGSNDLQKKCGPFLEQSGGRPLYRGYGGKVTAKLKGEREVEIRKDRKPRDSSVYVHDLLNDYFLKKLGTKVRSEALFTTGDIERAQSYGTPHYILPVGNFKYVWAEYKGDPVYDTLRFATQIKNEMRVTKASEAEAVTKRILDEVTWHTDNLQKAIDSGAEIAILANTAIIIPVEKIPYSEIISR